jgi:hypothetical protein
MSCYKIVKDQETVTNQKRGRKRDRERERERHPPPPRGTVTISQTYKNMCGRGIQLKFILLKV